MDQLFCLVDAFPWQRKDPTSVAREVPWLGGRKGGGEKKGTRGGGVSAAGAGRSSVWSGPGVRGWPLGPLGSPVDSRHLLRRSRVGI